MKYVEVRIEVGNDAMKTSIDVKRALVQVATRIGEGRLRKGDQGRIRDINGNSVGIWLIGDDTEKPT